jgi:hypothetical protein
MILLIAVAVIIVALFLFRASRAKSTATSAAHPTASTVAKHPARAVHGVKPRSHKHAKPLTAAQQRAGTLSKRRKVYAARIVPVMDRSSRVFDGAVHAVSAASGNFDTLQRSCSYWGGRVEAIEGEYEGVPHPYLWWTPAGTLHHQVSGIYHYMLGAIQNCQEAVQATDSSASSAAISEMATAARNLHNQENVARYFATH